MRTRRSPRNQQILWKALGGPTEAKPIIAEPLTEAQIDAMWWIGKTSRNLMKRDLQRAKVQRAIKGTSNA